MTAKPASGAACAARVTTVGADLDVPDVAVKCGFRAIPTRHQRARFERLPVLGAGIGIAWSTARTILA
jgi:hypothetical protein